MEKKHREGESNPVRKKEKIEGRNRCRISFPPSISSPPPPSLFSMASFGTFENNESSGQEGEFVHMLLLLQRRRRQTLYFIGRGKGSGGKKEEEREPHIRGQVFIRPDVLVVDRRGPLLGEMFPWEMDWFRGKNRRMIKKLTLKFAPHQSSTSTHIRRNEEPPLRSYMGIIR